MSKILDLLIGIEFSVESPLSRRTGHKHCPYCGSNSTHDEDCDLNELILSLIESDTVDEAKLLEIHNVLSTIEWVGAYQICLFCDRNKREGHERTCFFKSETYSRE